MTTYTSRKGKLSCTPSEIFVFVTDIRNFKQFLPHVATEGAHMDKDFCSLHFPQVGNITFRLAGKEPFRRVVFTGTALGSSDFTMTLSINEDPSGKAGIIVTLNAELNPLLRMIASQHIERFLEILIVEMEKYNDWSNVIV